MQTNSETASVTLAAVSENDVRVNE